MRYPLAWAVAVLAGCGLPADQSAALRVELDTLPDLYVGDTVQLRARLVRGAQGGVLEGARVRFGGGDPAVLEILASGRALAVGAGTATLTAQAADFAGVSATLAVTVRTGFRVDSVAPDTVSFGDTLIIYGIGINQSLVTVRFGTVEAPVRGFVPEHHESRNGPARLIVWVPTPAPAASMVSVAGEPGAAIVPTPVIVRQYDRYEPNDTAPAYLGVLEDSIVNPAVAIEASAVPGNASSPLDWYVFDNPRVQDVTVYGAFLADSLTVVPFLAARRWMIGGTPSFSGGGQCLGSSFDSWQAARVPLRALPAGRYHLAVLVSPQSSTARAYELRVMTGYHSERAPDDAEENDYCDAAASLVVPGIRRNLNLDEPGDVDWFRFTVSGERRGVVIDAIASDTLAFILTGLYAADGARLAGGQLGTNQHRIAVNLDPGSYLLAVGHDPISAAVEPRPTTSYRIESTVGALVDTLPPAARRRR